MRLSSVPVSAVTWLLALGSTRFQAIEVVWK